MKLERFVPRVIHPKGSFFTVALKPVEPPVLVPARRHHDLPLRWKKGDPR